MAKLLNLAYNYGTREYTKGKITYQQYLKAIKPQKRRRKK